MPPLQGTGADQSPYQRPGQKWICGHSSDGAPCRIGPSSQGQCRATWECTPAEQGTRWRCMRPASAGGPCSEGPLPSGSCSRTVPPCQPIRSLNARRGLVIRLAVIFSFALVLLLFLPLLLPPFDPAPGQWGDQLQRWAELIVSPGALSMPHNTIANCNQCHPADMGQSADLGSTTACLECHSGPAAPDKTPHSLQPHSLQPQQLAALTQQASQRGASPTPSALQNLFGLEVPKNEHGAMACATCHREHRGRLASITHMDAQRCQACHLGAIDQLTSHPEFSQYPPVQSRYRFDHQAHAQRMPGAQFACANCHSADPRGIDMQIARFETACSSCHTHTEQIAGGPGLALFQLPAVDIKILDEALAEIGEWPSEATYDGLGAELEPFMELLLRADPETKKALEILNEAGAELGDLSGHDDAVVRAGARLAWGIKEVFYDLLVEGTDGLEERLAVSLGDSLAPHWATLLAGGSRQPAWMPLVERALEQWLPNIEEEVEDYRDGFGTPLVPLDEYADLGNARQSSWVSEEYLLLYHPRRHGDPLMRNWIDLLINNPARRSGPLAGMAPQLLDEKGPGRCAKCHSPADGDLGPVQWRRSTAKGLTRFAHSPHLLHKLECENCHSMEPPPAGSLDASGFAPLTKSFCLACHGRENSPETCLDCHNYHATSFTTPAAAP
ncbi:MAG: hypothetical protein GKR89_28285 [Candidatus Latescibacteria bacterium]|nr:hypothetical protein [Candidatus Latescibacterota bacterium]